MALPFSWLRQIKLKNDFPKDYARIRCNLIRDNEKMTIILAEIGLVIRHKIVQFKKINVHLAHTR